MKRTIAIVGLLIVIGVLGILAYLQLTPTMQVSPTPGATRNPTQSPTATEAATGPCRPDIEFVTFSDPDFGYSIEYPKDWYIESYSPGERQYGSGGKLPNLMLAIAAIDGDFSPQVSQQGDVGRLFVIRQDVDSTTLSDYLAVQEEQNKTYNFGLTFSGENLTVDFLPGFRVITRGPNQTGVSNIVFLSSSTHSFVLQGSVLAGQSETQCLGTINKIQETFKLNSN